MIPENINNTKLLSNYLKIDMHSLNTLISKDYILINDVSDNQLVIDPILFIRQIKISKKKGGIRTVYSIESDTLSNSLKILNQNLNKLYKVPNCVHGFVKGRNIKSNALAHLAKKFVLVVDIKDYFETIDRTMLIKCFNKLGFTYLVSEQISSIVTYKNYLLQGFHTSPTLANIIFEPLDVIFSNIKNITYTRYADDLYFSSEDDFSILETIRLKLDEFGFEINDTKTKLMKRGWHQYVTGLTIFDDKYPRISKKIKRSIRQEVHYIYLYGYRSHVLYKLGLKPKDYFGDSSVKKRIEIEIEILKSRLNGWLLFINSIEPRFSKKHSKLLKNRKRDE
tara:strand:- start:57721 stop:58731 length:1011 start_codon:yes stop_codon:yes gene_type:complete